VLLLLVAGVAIALRAVTGTRDTETGPDITAEVRKPDDPPRVIAQALHARVDDEARILAPFGTKLGRMADSFYDDLGIDIHIVTRTDAASSIESQADQVFQQRKIGAGAPTGGLLVILNPELASARIEVGYSLEGALTDLHMGRIARDQLAPYTSYGAAGMAVMDVLHYLRDHVYLSAALGNLTLQENFRNRPAYLEFERFTSGGAGARTALSALPMDADLKRTVPTGMRVRYAPSSKLEESVAAFLRATADLAGDPTLELFTEGSRLMRAHYPLARFEELQRFERIDASMPLDFLQRGDYAVATSRRPVTGFVPILLHREQGLWRIDMVETWKNLFFDSSGNYILRNSNTPYAFGLTQFGSGRHYDIAPIPLGTSSIAGALAELERRQDAVSALRRAEIWLRNGFVFPRALSSYEEALRAAPKDPLVLQTLGDRALYLGFPELAIPALEKIGRGVELSLAEAYNDLGDPQAARHWVSRALEEDAYDLYALRWQKFLAERDGRTDEARRSDETIAMLSADPKRSASPVVLSFNPPVPRFEPDTTIDVNGTEVFDHSHFGVTMRNTSNRSVEIESVMLTSMGTAAASGLGDIRSYWRFPAGQDRLLAGESVAFNRAWGFTVNTGHQHVRYVFRTCWHGVGTTVRQYRTQWVDTMP
jgi:tetratricopeptide (TPR) repeat protein